MKRGAARFALIAAEEEPPTLFARFVLLEDRALAFFIDNERRVDLGEVFVDGRHYGASRTIRS
jgi:hypothetical protein